MQIEKNSVVSINYELTDSAGKLIEKTDSPISYLHGGYGGIFPMVEEALQSQEVGHSCSVTMEPENTFGEYDAELIRSEPSSVFPDNVAIGMQFEGEAEGTEEVLIYTVTDIADGKVIVDGNHPFAGMTLNFSCTVTDVRAATDDELAHGHVHGPHGHENH